MSRHTTATIRHSMRSVAPRRRLRFLSFGRNTVYPAQWPRCGNKSVILGQLVGEIECEVCLRNRFKRAVEKAKALDV